MAPLELFPCQRKQLGTKLVWERNAIALFRDSTIAKNALAAAALFGAGLLLSPSVTAAQTNQTLPPPAAAYGDALRWYERAARAGDPQAQFFLGVQYEQGLLYPVDKAAAVRWYRVAADQGYPQALFRLGLLYETGDGVPRDPRRAAVLYGTAANAGLVEAAYNHAILMDAGIAGIRDPALAAERYRAAANGGIAEAAAALAVLLWRGDAVKPDRPQAYRLLSQAARAGVDGAAESRTRLWSEMTPAERIAASRAAD